MAQSAHKVDEPSLAGGGIIHVPALVYLLHFPVCMATATSHFISVVMALTGTVVHFVTGTFVHGVHRTLLLVRGVVIGAQAGEGIYLKKNENQLDYSQPGTGFGGHSVSHGGISGQRSKQQNEFSLWIMTKHWATGQW